MPTLLYTSFINTIPKTLDEVAKKLYLATGVVVELDPKTPSDTQELVRYCNEVQDKFGLEFPNHYNYAFHSSLLYSISGDMDTHPIHPVQ